MMHMHADELDSDAPVACPGCGDYVPDDDLWPTGAAGTGESVCTRCYDTTYGGTGTAVRAESVSFDKFMDDMITRRRAPLRGPDTPLRRRAAAHQERPLGRTRYAGGSR